MLSSGRSRKFRFIVEGIDESGYPAAMSVQVVFPLVKGQGAAVARNRLFEQHPQLLRWRQVEIVK